MVKKVNIFGSNKLNSLKSKLKYLIGASILVLVIVIVVVLVFNFNTSADEPSQKSPNGSDDDLIFAHTICRHGDRNPYEPYPNDPWKSEEHWLEGYAQLTKIGKQQLFELGQYLRQRYAKLLGNGDYSADKVFIHSTDTDRTLMSAETCMASLFPPQGDQIWYPELSLSHYWQPVPVHTEPRNEDYLLAPEKPCDRYEYEMIQYTNSSEYKSLFEKNDALMKNLEEKTGQRLNSLTKLNFLYDTLFIEKLKGKSIPPWAEEAMKPGGDFEYLALFYFTIFAQTKPMKMFRSGFLLKEILERSANKTLSTLTSDLSMVLYFAHDNSIADMLNSLGLLKLHVPPYASCLFFELYKTNNATENYLQLFYRNSTHSNIIPALEIPNCGSSKCPLDRWFELYKDILPTESYDEECRLRNGETISINENPEHFYL